MRGTKECRPDNHVDVLPLLTIPQPNKFVTKLVPSDKIYSKSTEESKNNTFFVGLKKRYERDTGPQRLFRPFLTLPINKIDFVF